MKNYDPMYEHFKCVYPDTVKSQLTMATTPNKAQAKAVAEQFAKIQQSQILLWKVEGNTVVVYTSVQFKAVAAKMVKGAKVVYNVSARAPKRTFTIISDGVVYCNGLASIEVDKRFSGLYEVTYFKLEDQA